MKDHSIGVQNFAPSPEFYHHLNPKAYCMKSKVRGIYLHIKIEARIWEKGIQEFEGLEISESQKDRPLCCRGN